MSRILILSALIILVLLATPTAYAATPQQEAPSAVFAEVFKFISAAAAFMGAAFAAGWAISRAGSSGLAASAERPEVRTTAIIIAAFGEALAIYGIVIAFFILGA